MRMHLRAIAAGILGCACALLGASSAFASIEVNYVGTAAGTVGLSAKAVYDLVSTTQLKITLTNTSSGTYGGAGVNGDAKMVLSSLNFELGSVTITGGSIALNGTSTVVKRSGSAWATDGAYAGNLNSEYGYANAGIGNNLASAILSGVTSTQVTTDLKNAVTSHDTGGGVSNFLNGGGLTTGGVTPGLVALGSTGFGNSHYVLDSVIITLNLSGLGLSNYDFLKTGSYVEFGSDYAYVGGTPTPDPNGEPTVPEPASLAVFSVLATIAGAGYYRRSKV
jgi:hypothetical protein